MQNEKPALPERTVAMTEKLLANLATVTEEYESVVPEHASDITQEVADTARRRALAMAHAWQIIYWNLKRTQQEQNHEHEN